MPQAAALRHKQAANLGFSSFVGLAAFSFGFLTGQRDGL
jgi:hypothetical protein